MLHLSQSLSGLTLLVVDSEPDSADLLAVLLQLDGATVLTATSFGEAVEALSRIKPDLLLTSIQLLGADGYLLLQYLRAFEAEQGDAPIPAVAIVGSLREAAPEQLRGVGFQGYLAKPIIPSSVLTLVMTLTGRTPPAPSVIYPRSKP